MDNMLCNMNLKKQLLTLLLLFLMIGTTFAQSMDRRQERKFVYLTSVGFSTGLGIIKYEERSLSNTIPLIKVDQVLAYQFNNYIFTGVGVGVNAWKNAVFMPLFLNVSVNVLDKPISPHWYLNAGYSMKWHTSQKPEQNTRVLHGATPGFYGETGIGAHLNYMKKVSFIFSVSYTVQDTYMKYSVVKQGEPDLSMIITNQEKRTLYHFIGAKVGIRY